MRGRCTNENGGMGWGSGGACDGGMGLGCGMEGWMHQHPLGFLCFFLPQQFWFVFLGFPGAAFFSCK